MDHMTVDDAIAIASERSVDLWRRCDHVRGQTPDSLRGRALERATGEVGVMDQLPRVQIVNKAHPHFEEFGRFTGKIVRFVWGDAMAEVKLDNCRHGTDGCFVSEGDVILAANDNN